MKLNGPNCSRIGLWCALGALLLAWNGAVAALASPSVMLDRFDDVQYQLLARNHLCGHYEVGDEALTVHQEGRHPMWRPGLVWIEEGLARCLSSVRQGAAAASALGTTFLELALLCLAWCSFGKKTFLFVLIGMAVPAVSLPFLELAVGQGPEVWAAAAIVGGLAVLVEALRRRSVCWALAAGTLAGLAEWFRTGNLLLFAVPCAVYSLAGFRQRDRRGFCLPAGALIAWVGITALAELAAPSSVNKTIVNLWDCRVDLGCEMGVEEDQPQVEVESSLGPPVTVEYADGSRFRQTMLGYTLVPETTEIYMDYVVRCSRGRSTLSYCWDHAGEIGHAYLQRLQQVLTSGFRGLRRKIGDLVFILFGVQLLVCSAPIHWFGKRPRECGHYQPGLDAASHTFAVAGAALGHYFGPLVLVAGNHPTRYLLVTFPLFVLIAARGALQLAYLLAAAWKRWQSIPPAQPHQVPWPFVAGGLGVLLGMSAFTNLSAAQLLGDIQRQALDEQAAVDSLGLEEKKVACRNMCWFVDRKVQTILLPYATVPELETYVRKHGIDGILVESEGLPAFKATPYGSASAFDRALQESALFGPPQASGTWRWYPVRLMATAKEQL